MRSPSVRAPESALLPYCGKPHRLIDGAPLAHSCRVIPPEAIAAAILGDFDQAITLFARAAAGGSLPAHGGVWKLRRRK